MLLSNNVFHALQRLITNILIEWKSCIPLREIHFIWTMRVSLWFQKQQFFWIGFPFVDSKTGVVHYGFWRNNIVSLDRYITVLKLFTDRFILYSTNITYEGLLNLCGFTLFSNHGFGDFTYLNFKCLPYKEYMLSDDCLL